MEQKDRRIYLIQQLIAENEQYRLIEIPEKDEEQEALLRRLMNLRLPAPIPEEVLKVQDEYLKELNAARNIVKVDSLKEVQPDLYIVKGDITLLAADAIVTTATWGLTGSYQPNHETIDNLVHSYAGMQMRQDTRKIIENQGADELEGEAKITSGYNLPAKYVIHTVGPYLFTDSETIFGQREQIYTAHSLRKEHESILRRCYRNCLMLAIQNGFESIAFPCISTGVCLFPHQLAAEIAVATVKEVKAETGSNIKVIFDVFQDVDEEIYKELLK